VLISRVESGWRWASGGSAPPSQWSPVPPGKTTQRRSLLVVLHGEDKGLVSSALGWGRAVERGCGDAVLGAGFGSELLSHLGGVWGVT